MLDKYRAPEVILGMDWDYKVDIWNAGVVVRMCSLTSETFQSELLNYPM